MEIYRSDLKHEDPDQDIIWEDDDLILDLKEEMIRILQVRPIQIIIEKIEEHTEPKIILLKSTSPER